MLDPDMPEFAVRGERGFDVFQRVENPGQKRARFRCVATLTGAGAQDAMQAHEPLATRAPERMRAAVAVLLADARLGQSFALGDSTGWPRAAQGGDPLLLFLYHEFFRAWQVADLAFGRVMAGLRRNPAMLLDAPGRATSSVLPLYEFNRQALAVDLVRVALPAMRARIDTPGWRDERDGGTGYALRMLGDLCLRAGEPAEALRCFEAAVATGENAHRRRRCIEAAHAAGDALAIETHHAAYRARWPLPADLARLQTEVTR